MSATIVNFSADMSNLPGDSTESDTAPAAISNLLDNLDNIRYVVKTITGEAAWDTAPSVALSTLEPVVYTHATRHQNAGSDEVSVTGLDGLLADAQRWTPTTGNQFKPTDGGANKLNVAAGIAVIDNSRYAVAAEADYGLTDDTGNYIYINHLGAVAHNATGWPSNALYLPVAYASVSASDILVLSDRRALMQVTGVDRGVKFYGEDMASVLGDEGVSTNAMTDDNATIKDSFDTTNKKANIHLESSDATQLKHYFVIKQWQIPEFFNGFPTSNALVVNARTEVSNASQNHFNLKVYNAATAVCSLLSQASSPENWSNFGFNLSALEQSTVTWTAGDMLTVEMKVYSCNDKHVEAHSLELNEI